ncbi:Rdx family protein [Bacillus sp. YZJH907-2]|uniref:Rdx family protein n=1 Tax=Halalkalibacter suaedae TaxID=2822140 RepID=A0A940X199_9BACI|nr:Rdx family protein [Bacillus suaedae]
MSFADDILDHFRGKVKEVKLVTSSGGVFEVTVNGEKLYSKKETGEFPESTEVIEKMEAMSE